MKRYAVSFITIFILLVGLVFWNIGSGSISISWNELWNVLMNHTEEGDDEAYAKAWFDFIADWNDELPEIPLYSNDYHDFFTSKLHDFEEDGYNWDATNAILYANME